MAATRFLIWFYVFWIGTLRIVGLQRSSVLPTIAASELRLNPSNSFLHLRIIFYWFWLLVDVISHVISYGHMWYHTVISHMISWCDLENECDITMMSVFVAYDFTCDITVFFLWYHIILISHCYITHDITCDVELHHII